MSKPRLPDIKTILQAGINPKNGLPLKMTDALSQEVKNNIKRNLRIIDEQDAVKRYTWYNLPSDLDGTLIERILYYKGQAFFFYIEAIDQFFFLPFALEGDIDVYGRYNNVRPLPFNDGKTDKNKRFNLLHNLNRKVIKDLPEIITYEEVINSGVILWDYSKQLSENNIPRCILNEPLVELEAEILTALRTSMLNCSGVSGLKVDGEDEINNVYSAQKQYYNAVMTGQKWIPIAGMSSKEFQELDNDGGKDSQEYLQVCQAIDNLRLSTYGIQNGGLFEKQGTIIQSEADFACSNTNLIMQDGLDERQRFCNLINGLFGLNVWVEITQPITALEPNQEQEKREPLVQTGESNNGGDNNVSE